jgi:hypothetical protein
MIAEQLDMTWPMRDFDLASRLAMYAATAAGLLVVFMAVGGLVLLVESLLRRGRYRQSNRP